MVLADNPAAAIFSMKSRNAPLDTSPRNLSPSSGRTHLSSACCHPKTVAGLTGLRRRVGRDAIHFAAWARNVIVGAVLARNDSLLLIPSTWMCSRSFLRATLREEQVPNETVRRFLSEQPCKSIQYRPYVGAVGLHGLLRWNTLPVCPMRRDKDGPRFRLIAVAGNDSTRPGTLSPVNEDSVRTTGSDPNPVCEGRPWRDYGAG